ncbi:hypothetical protein HDV05_007808 [Chytridiales sp. JEL 0842]|nr:hypothetical protein HDV05_007808 [Chytridiales sp. JEL 0842]
MLGGSSGVQQTPTIPADVGEQELEAYGISNVVMEDLKSMGRSQSFKKPQRAATQRKQQVPPTSDIPSNETSDQFIAASSGRLLSPLTLGSMLRSRSDQRGLLADREDTLKEELRAEKQRADSLLDELESYKKKYMNLLSEASRQRNTDEEEHMTSEALRKDVAELTKELQRKERERLQADQITEELAAELEDLKLEATKSEEVKNTLLRQVSVLTDRMSQFDGIVRSLEEALSEEISKRKASEEREKTLLEKNVALEQQLKTSNDAIEMLKLKPKRQQSIDDFSKTIIEQLRTELDNVTTQNQTLIEEVENLRMLNAHDASQDIPKNPTRSPTKKHVPPRSSSAVGIIDKLPASGSLEGEMLKQRVVSGLQEQIRQLQKEVQDLRKQNRTLVEDMVATLNSMTINL